MGARILSTLTSIVLVGNALAHVGCGGPREVNDALEPGDSQPAPSGHFRAIIAVRDTGQTDVGGAEQIRALAEAVAARHHLTIIRILTLTPAFVAIVDSSRLDTLRRDPNVRYVEPDRLVRNRENPR